MIPRGQENIIKTLDMAITGVKTCKDVAKRLKCSVKTARRYFWRLYNMNHEYENFDIELINTQVRGELLKIRVRIK